MSVEQQIISTIQQLLQREDPMNSSTLLQDDLGLDSANLIELTVLIHSVCGVDLGRRAAEMKIIPESVGDLVKLVEHK